MSAPDQQLITNLLEQQKSSAYAQQLSQEPQENALAITRVVTAKYKVYVIILLILGVFLGTKYLPEAFQHYQAVQAQKESKADQLQQLKLKGEQLTQDKLQLLSLQQYQEQLVQCVNEQKSCSELPDLLKKDKGAAIAYLQMGSLRSEKMTIDEQKILKNLDQYLIKNSPGEKASTANGVIEGIEIGEPQALEGMEGFFRLPLLLKVTFSDKDDLISFVDNIEKFIIPEAKDRILYQIEEVSYDMMAYDEAQTTDITLSAYYFN